MDFHGLTVKVELVHHLLHPAFRDGPDIIFGFNGDQRPSKKRWKTMEKSRENPFDSLFLGGSNP
jgi:hypothetical protein